MEPGLPGRRVVQVMLKVKPYGVTQSNAGPAPITPQKLGRLGLA
jgi:hypothetical protein